MTDRANLQAMLAGMRLVEVTGHEERYVLCAVASAEQFQADCQAAVEAIRARPDDSDECNFAGCPWVPANEIARWLVAAKGYVEIRAGDAFVWFDAAHVDQPDSEEEGAEGVP